MKKSRRRYSEAGQSQQLCLLDELRLPNPPSTRYQGSKLKLLDWIWDNVKDLKFNSVLDAFGGTGCVAYLMKSRKKRVTYNDSLKFNQIIGKAIIENASVTLPFADIDSLQMRHSDRSYDDMIERTFSDIYFTDEENRWLDVVCQNIALMTCEYQQAIAYYALFQSCIVKRPYNLFHRKNLYMRTSEVERSFGNKATWDTPFEAHFRAFVAEANNAVFASGVPCSSLCHDARQVPGDFDLVYIDTPYVNKNGLGVDYLDFYHFLEGLTDYRRWPTKLNTKRKHLPLNGDRSPWSDRKQTREAFEELFQRYSRSILVVSYRSDGIPSEAELVELLRKHKSRIKLHHFGGYKYVLSTNGDSKEILLIGY